MKREDLKPGLYHLTREVVNPKPDRRVAYDWRGLEVRVVSPRPRS